MRIIMVLLTVLVNTHLLAKPQERGSFDTFYKKESTRLNALYQTLHHNPELSLQEKNTSKRMAKELRMLGFEVTEGIGGYGVVGLMKNGPGKTILIRTDMDALPVQEKTNRAYQSNVSAPNKEGKNVPVMHACGHDMHMSAFIGAAQYLSEHKKDWSGTLMMVAQPAEEIVAGARRMLSDRLYERFGTPDYNLALHVSADLPAGDVGLRAQYAFANVDTVRIHIKGKGGHGAFPQTTVDPIILAAKLVLSLQTIVSRNIDPLKSAVVTIGSLQAGTKSNIIPDDATLMLSIRSYEPVVRDKILHAIKQQAKGLAIAEGLAQQNYPSVSIIESVSAVYNDEALMNRLRTVFKKVLKSQHVKTVPPIMGSEDFGLFSLHVSPHIPSAILWLGTVEPKTYQKAKANTLTLPSIHSAYFDPNHKNTLKTGITILSSAALHLFNDSNGADKYMLAL